MNYNDLNYGRFALNGTIYPLNKQAAKVGSPLRGLILFLLNIHRNRWVSTKDLLDFAYSDTPIDQWPDCQENNVNTAIYWMRKILPSEVRIGSQRSRGYRLTIEGDIR
jgi:hypothetical protein